MKSRILVAVVGVPVLVWAVLWAPTLVMMAALALLAGIEKDIANFRTISAEGLK